MSWPNKHTYIFKIQDSLGCSSGETNVGDVYPAVNRVIGNQEAISSLFVTIAIDVEIHCTGTLWHAAGVSCLGFNRLTPDMRLGPAFYRSHNFWGYISVHGASSNYSVRRQDH